MIPIFSLHLISLHYFMAPFQHKCKKRSAVKLKGWNFDEQFQPSSKQQQSSVLTPIKDSEIVTFWSMVLESNLLQNVVISLLNLGFFSKGSVWHRSSVALAHLNTV